MYRLGIVLRVTAFHPFIVHFRGSKQAGVPVRLSFFKNYTFNIFYSNYQTIISFTFSSLCLIFTLTILWRETWTTQRCTATTIVGTATIRTTVSYMYMYEDSDIIILLFVLSNSLR